MDDQTTPLFADRLDALAARLDAQAARMADLEAENAGLKVQLARIAQPTVPSRAAALSVDPKVGRRGMLTKVLAATAAAAVLTVAKEPQRADASVGATVTNNSTTTYGLAASPGTSQLFIPATAGHTFGVVGTTTGAGVAPSVDAGVYGATTLSGEAGVLGLGGLGTGVWGQSESFFGVRGESTTHVGVGGISNSDWGVWGRSQTNQGVRGESVSGTGTYGQSTSSMGVHGQTGSASQPAVRGDGQGVGVLGTATGSGIGLWGTAVSGIALLGTSTSGIGLSGSTGGNNVGVFGSADGPGMIGGIGLVGRSANGTGVVGQGATAARFDGPVIINGSLTTAGGANSAAVRHPDGEYRRMYSQESTEPWFEDFGTADLRDGRAEVALDPEYDAVVKDNEYLVFLTELGDCGGLYISQKHSHSFEVRSRAGAAAIGAFHYRVVARRRDEVGRRMEKVTVRHGRLDEPVRLPDMPPQSPIRSVPVSPERPSRQ